MRRKLIWPEKDPDEVLDYGIEWSERLGDKQIAGVQWTVPAGLTLVSQAAPAGTITTIIIGGGVEGVTYKVGCRLTTTDGLILEESPQLRIRSR